MKKLLILVEQVFTVAALLIYSGAILTLVLSGGEQQNEFVEFDSSLIRLIYLFIYIITFLLLILRWRKTFYTLSQDRWIFPLIVLAAISIIWSFEQATTLKNSFTLIGSSLFGLYLASRYTLKQQLQILCWTFSIAIVLSFTFAILLPKYGIMGGIHQGKWRGIFLHKNGLGAAMANSSIVFFILGYQGQKYRCFFWLGLGLSILLLLLSASTSSFLNLVILVMAFFIFQTFRWPNKVIIPMLIILTILGQCLYLLLSSNANVLFAALGKDTTLTGRTQLWPFVMEMIWKHPWFGYGYGGFWQGWNGESAYIWRAVGWTPTHPHNGFLALWLDLGLLGLGLFFLGFWRSYLQALTWVRKSKTVVDLWPLLYMTYVVLINIAETSLLSSNNITWILYVAVSLSVFFNSAPQKNIINNL
jgi:exopolysaccharide production protein ExoQ